MQGLDPHTLFSIFEQGDEQVYKEHGMQDVLSNPFVLVGMVVTGVQNYHLMDLMYMRQFPTEYKQVRQLTKRKYFNNLYKYLLRVDIDNIDNTYDIGESFDIKEAKFSLNTLLKFYEDLEEYEKCAVIVKFIRLFDR